MPDFPVGLDHVVPTAPGHNDQRMKSSNATSVAIRRVSDYGLTIPAVAMGLLAGSMAIRAGEAPFAVAPLALVVALSAWYGGFGPRGVGLPQGPLRVALFLW